MSSIQTKMNSAYQKWQENPDWSQARFLDSLTMVQRRAVVLGNLNYQVNNGGFLQWLDNGYAETAGPVLHLIAEELGTDKFPQLTEALHLAKEAIRFGVGSVKLDHLDHDFYKLDALESEMDTYVDSIEF